MINRTFGRVLVLGSNSFSASHFIDYLLQHTDSMILGVSRSPEPHPAFLAYRYNKEPEPKHFRFVQGCLNRNRDQLRELFDEFKPELIVNFAAQGEVRNSWKWPEQWYQTNCLAVVYWCDFFRQLESLKLYVSISTPEVYGSTGENIIENHEFSPSTPYGVAKLSGDLHIEALVKHYQFPAIFTRAANVYGPHQQLYRIIPRTILYQMEGRKLTLHGGGRVERGFVFIKDVAEATFCAATRGNIGEGYHISESGQLISIRELVETTCRIMDVSTEGFLELIDENFGQDDCFSLPSSSSSKSQ